MEIKDSLKKIRPYTDEGLNKIYNLLFCDDLRLFETGEKDLIYPWTILLSASSSTEELEAVAADNSLESRHHLLAFGQLQSRGVSSGSKELLGVIVEVGLSGGLDVLAAYGDGTARYINHSGSMVVWESPTNESDRLMDDLFGDAARVVDRIGPWTEERLTAPGPGIVRLTFLVSDGLYFGEGPFSVLKKDEMGGPVIDAATSLMIFLTQEVNNS